MCAQVIVAVNYRGEEYRASSKERLASTVSLSSLHHGHLILDCWLATSSFPSRLGSFPSPHLLCQIVIDTFHVPQDQLWRTMIALSVHETI